MSDKTKKFEPSTGWLVAINYQQVNVHRLAEALGIEPIAVGKALDTAGYLLEADPFGYLSDVWKIIEIEKRKGKEHLSVVEDKTEIAESISELDEEEMEQQNVD
jgi:hypothetical protein